MTPAGLAATALKVNTGCCCPASSQTGRGEWEPLSNSCLPEGEKGKVTLWAVLLFFGGVSLIAAGASATGLV